jgi:hypothetical protein
MSDSKNNRKQRISKNPLRRLYDNYAAGVGYISVKDFKGDEHIGTCFHIGDGVFITARHVVESRTIILIGSTHSQTIYFETEETKTNGSVEIETPFESWLTTLYKGPYFHPDDRIDIAALVLPDVKAPVLPLGGHLDDWLDNYFILSNLLVLGYPPIPFTSGPTLIASKCEVNGIIDKYTGGHPHFIVSAMARGGFSGGPAISEDGYILGIITESLTTDHQPTELGYLSVLSVEGIYACIAHNRIVPSHIDEEWEGFWNTESTHFAFDCRLSNVSDIAIYRGKDRYYFTMYGFNENIRENALEIIAQKFKYFYSLTWIHEEMIKIEFKEFSLSEELASHIYNSILLMIDNLGIRRFSSSIDNDKPFDS